jgi:hypothetical protein
VFTARYGLNLYALCSLGKGLIKINKCINIYVHNLTKSYVVGIIMNEGETGL